MFVYMLILYLNIFNGLCFSNYELFRGFDEEVINHEVDIYANATHENTDTTTTTIKYQRNESNFEPNLHYTTIIYSTDKPTTPNYTNITLNTKGNKNVHKPTCLEEQPSNIGSYEVPTEKDVLYFTRDLLLDLFETYKKDAMALLRDIKEITKATSAIEKKCTDKTAYRECVKLVSTQSEVITKSLVTSIEMEKHDVKDLTENNVCSLSEMKKDPISLIKLMVQETVMLKFALPGFLRLLNSCTTYCKTLKVAVHKKPLRRMTDQDLVVKYFLTKKNYVQLIKDSRRAV